MQLLVENRSGRALRVPAGAQWSAGQFRFGVELRVTGAGGAVYRPMVPPDAYTLDSDDPSLYRDLEAGASFEIGLEVGDFLRADWQETGELLKLSHQPGRYEVSARLVGVGTPPTETAWARAAVVIDTTPADR